MSYAEHVQQLQDHAAQTAVAADWAIDTMLAGATDSELIAACEAADTAANAARKLRRAVRKLARMQLDGTLI